MPGKISVPMPETLMYTKASVRRDHLVEQFGEPTVSRAEVSVLLNLMFMTGMVRPNEFIDLMMMQCRRIDEERRAAARLDADKG